MIAQKYSNAVINVRTLLSLACNGFICSMEIGFWVNNND